MLARYLRRTIACILACWAVLVFVLWGRSPALALSSALFAPALLAATLALQFASAALVNRRHPSTRVTLRQLFHAWMQETAVAALVFFWWQPFRSDRYPDQCASHEGRRGQRGILFVHGFICNRGVWNAWFPELDRRKIPYVALNLEPVFASIETYCASLDDAVARLHTLTGRPPLVVCHSMGGLAVRNWLHAVAADARVHRVVTIGSPHWGTRIGAGMPHLPWIANAQQMRIESNWLKQLAGHEPLARRAKFVCFYSNCDNIVFPSKSATLPDADNRHVAGVAHLALAMDENLRAQTLELL